MRVQYWEVHGYVLTQSLFAVVSNHIRALKGLLGFRV